MSIEAETSSRDEYVLVRCAGTFTVQGLLEVFDAALDAAAADGRRATLVDIRGLTGSAPNSMERHELGVRVADRQKSMGYSVALVVVGEEPIVDPERFAEVVARNRGAYARVFTELGEAESWIAEEAGRIP